MKTIKATLILLLISIFIAGAQDTTRVIITIGTTKYVMKTFQAALNEKRGDALSITVRKGVYNLSGGISTTRANTSVIFEKGAVIYFSSNVSAGVSVQHSGFSLENANIKGKFEQNNSENR